MKAQSRAASRLGSEAHIQLPLLYSPGPLPRKGSVQSELGPPPTSIINQELAPTALLPSQFSGGNSSLKVPSSWVCQADKQN